MTQYIFHITYYTLHITHYIMSGLLSQDGDSRPAERAEAHHVGSSSPLLHILYFVTFS